MFQLCLDEEVSPDSSKAQRSTTTGHLVITMPKAKGALVPTKKVKDSKDTKKNVVDKCDDTKTEMLEADPSKYSMPDIGNIVKDKTIVPPLGTKSQKIAEERENSPDFVDDPDVPALI